MIRIMQFNRSSNSSSEISIDEMDFHNLKWIDSLNPTSEELEKIKTLLNIPETEFERCIDRDERPGIRDSEHFSIIIFKAPFKKKKNYGATSFSILISENLLVTLRSEALTGIDNIWSSDDKTRNKIFQKGTSYLAYQILEKIMDDYFTIADHLEKEIDNIEDMVFHNTDKKTVNNIFSMKKTLIYFHKALSANREVLSGVNKEYADKIHPSFTKHFRYVYDDTVQLIDMVATYRDILTGSLDIYLTNVSNNLNNIMKRMTAVGSLVLVPTFITGLYGMNFRYMPEIMWKYGYLFAGGLMALSVVLLIIYFKKKDWF